MTGSNNKKRRVRTIALTNKTAGADGAIRLEEQTNAMDAAAKHLLPTSIGATEVAIVSLSMPTEVDTIDNDNHNVTPSTHSTQNDFQPHRQRHGGEGLQPVEQSHDELDIDQQMDNLQENERLKPSKPKVDKSKRDFFNRVDQLKAYKDEHGHLNVGFKEDRDLYDFCYNVKRSRKGKGKHTLDDNRIAALDAIGFKWEMASRFFARVDELRAYKEEHGHLKVDQKDDKSLNKFCKKVRQARRAIITGRARKFTIPN
jgi:hypothetical protein